MLALCEETYMQTHMNKSGPYKCTHISLSQTSPGETVSGLPVVTLEVRVALIRQRASTVTGQGFFRAGVFLLSKPQKTPPAEREMICLVGSTAPGSDA